MRGNRVHPSTFFTETGMIRVKISTKRKTSKSSTLNTILTQKAGRTVIYGLHFHLTKLLVPDIISNTYIYIHIAGKRTDGP